MAAWSRHRQPLALAALLDGLGLVLLASLIDHWRPGGGHLDQQKGLLVALLLVYWSLGWLFGSYTVLKLPRVGWSQLAVRLGTTSLASVAGAAILGWLLRVHPDVTLLHRGSLLPLFGLLTLWSAVVRLLLRRRPLQAQRWGIVALDEELEPLRTEWQRVATSPPLPTISVYDARHPLQAAANHDLAVALSPGVTHEANLQRLCQQVVGQGRPVSSLAEMAEQELQRIPPRWVGNQWLLFSGRIDGVRSSLSQQLKRYADVVVSLVLLTVTAPVLLLVALGVKLQDGGAVIYRQRRTGLLGQPFEVMKIRTMVPRAEVQGQPQWAQPNDSRITPLGVWLRRTRLDELPQLLNVLRGDMSLIGPRPERPELEETLEETIPNYRLRHWVRPGLSGWAQVNMPYGASVEDAELKLSYDLFYLRNATVWLDLLILLKTIKTVLKAAGR